MINTSTLTVATDWAAGETATLLIDWGTTGSGPYTIRINMGDGGAGIPPGTAATSPFTHELTLVEGGPFTWAVTITDVYGHIGTAAGTYTVGPTLNQAPTIEAVAYNEWSDTLTVTVADEDGDDVSVTVTDIDGLMADHDSVTVTGGNGDAVFRWTADDPLSGGNGTTTINVFDASRAAEPVTSPEVTVEPIDFGPNSLAALGAAPLQTTAAVGETVTVIVFASDFPAEAPFNYMSSVSVTFNEGVELVTDSFNIGGIGGDTYDLDGIWAVMDPAPTTFFQPQEYWEPVAPVTGSDPPLEFIRFSITPVGGGDVYGGGYLFNFGVTFDHAGTYNIGFLEFQDVKRTYYSDNAAVEHNWMDISNDIPDVPNSITVTE